MRLACVAAVLLVATLEFADGQARRVTWSDVTPIHAHFESRGFTADDFAMRIARLADDNARRVRLGDLDHLVFYLLQSTGFTADAAIEPALSARALVERLPERARDDFFRDPSTARDRVSGDVRARAATLLSALASPGDDRRLTYFARLLVAVAPDASAREQALLGEYLRVMRFVYEKEFGPGRTSAAEAARLYRTRGLSTDTAVEAGFLVAQGLGVLRGLEPTRRVRRVLVVGAGLDLAPRTALLEAAPPQSYQPWAVLDALVALGLARLDDVSVVAADINPRVVDHFRRTRGASPVLTLLTGIGDDGRVALTRDYREYFAALGRSIARAPGASEGPRGAVPVVPAGHLFKHLDVSPEAMRTVRAERLDVVTERLTGEAFDLIVATNVFPYFDDDALLLAMANITAMLRVGGVLLHNEARPALHEISVALDVPPSHSRHAVIATVKGAPSLGDSVWLHVRRDITRH